MNTRKVIWLITFTAALSIVVATRGGTRPGPGVTPGPCIDCYEQPCCTADFCPECSANCGASTETLPYMVEIADDGDWLEIDSDPQVCYTEYECIAMPQMCDDDQWWCLADYFNPTNVFIPGCAVGSPCP